MSRQSLIRLMTAAAWASIILIAYSTLTRVEFVYSIYHKLSPFLMRPEMTTFAHFEHIIVFVFVGALFGLAYPRRIFLACCIVVGTAVLLEVLQTFTPDRHGTLIDAFEKMAGGTVGVLVATAIQRFWYRRNPGS
jgi:VanZ family protein